MVLRPAVVPVSFTVAAHDEAAPPGASEEIVKLNAVSPGRSGVPTTIPHPGGEKDVVIGDASTKPLGRGSVIATLVNGVVPT